MSLVVMQPKGESLEIKEVAPIDAPVELLLEADPSIKKVTGYLGQSKCFVATVNEVVVGAYVVKAIAPDVYELMNVSVAPPHQQKGIGTMLLKHAISSVREMGARRLEVGTGTFGYQLTYYQREGFRVSAIERDFFLNNYPEAIYENGIQHKDMLRLILEYQ